MHIQEFSAEKLTSCQMLLLMPSMIPSLPHQSVMVMVYHIVLSNYAYFLNILLLFLLLFSLFNLSTSFIKYDTES